MAPPRSRHPQGLARQGYPGLPDPGTELPVGRASAQPPITRPSLSADRIRPSPGIETLAKAAVIAANTASAFDRSLTHITLDPLPLSHPVHAPAFTPAAIASRAPGIRRRR